MANFKGVAEIIRNYQLPEVNPRPGMTTSRLTWRNAGVAVGGAGRASEVRGMEIARLTAICRKSDCAGLSTLENALVRLRAQITTLEERNANMEEEGKAALAGGGQGLLESMKFGPVCQNVLLGDGLW
jgi:hypothetical protein